METSITTKKGQIVVPKKFREKYRIKPGTRVAFIENNGELIIKAMNKSYFESFTGILKGKGNVLKALMEEKAREKEL